MSIAKDVLRWITVYARKGFTKIGGGRFTRRSTAFMFSAAVAVLVSRPGGASPLSDAVDQIGVDATAISTTTTGLSRDVTSLASKYRMTNAGQCALLVVGLSSSGSVPIYFIPGPIPITGFNADIVTDSGISFTSVVTGPASAAAGKGVQSNVIGPGDIRFIDFGVNQNVLGPGIVAFANFDTSKASAGNHVFTLMNVAAADVNANGVPVCATTGVIKK